MPVSRKEKWVQIAELGENDQIYFTPSYLELMGELGWEALVICLASARLVVRPL
jgi:hypothetical protein